MHAGYSYLTHSTTFLALRSSDEFDFLTSENSDTMAVRAISQFPEWTSRRGIELEIPSSLIYRRGSENAERRHTTLSTLLKIVSSSPRDVAKR
jgi:hypothetical protein